MAMKWKLISLMLVLLMVGMAVAAAQPNSEDVKEKYEKYKEAWENYENAKQKYVQTHQKYKDLRNQIAFNHAKRFLNNGCSFAERWLERFRLYVENSKIDDVKKQEILSEIDKYINTIEEKRVKINDSQTPEELREAAKEMRQAWNEMRVNLRAMVGQVAAFKLQTVIQKAEGVEVRLEEKIQQLEAYGIDTSGLETILDEYSGHIQNANESVNSALALYEEGKANEANKELKEATKELKEAFNNIKKFVHRYREEVSQGKIFFGNETGEVWAHGDGTAKLSGDAVVNVRGNGTLIVSPIDAVVSVVGFGSSTKDEANNTVTFEGNGKAIVRGKDITVTITGERITLFAKGNGSIYLSGTGYYKVKKLPDAPMQESSYGNETTLCIGTEC